MKAMRALITSEPDTIIAFLSSGQDQANGCAFCAVEFRVSARGAAIAGLTPPKET